MTTRTGQQAQRTPTATRRRTVTPSRPDMEPITAIEQRSLQLGGSSRHSQAGRPSSMSTGRLLGRAHSSEMVDGVRPVVTITTSDSGSLVPALLRAGASVSLKRNKLAVRGLSAAQVARRAAARLATVTDLTTSAISRPGASRGAAEHAARTRATVGAGDRWELRRPTTMALPHPT